MRAWWGLAAGVAVALMVVGAIDRALPGSILPSALYGAVVMAAGPAALMLRRRRERQDRSAADGSIERDLAAQAAAWSFQVALIAIAGLGLFLVVTDQIGSGLIAFALLAVLIGAHWVRYAILRSRLA